MNKENIFKHIEEGEVPPQIIKTKKRINKSYVKMGMFIKMIANIDLFIEKFKIELKEENLDIDEEILVENVKKLFYTRAYGHLSQINFNNNSQIKIANKFDSKILKNSFNKALNFFEHIEDYDKCYFINEMMKKIKDQKKNLDI